MTMASRKLLQTAVNAPDRLDELTVEEWSRLLYLARGAALMARIAAGVRAAEIFGRLPDPVQSHLIAAERVANFNGTLIRWEIDRLQRAFWGRDQKLVLLKGAAYLARDFPWARSRLCSDIDILVPRDDLTLVEATLMAEGWQAVKLNSYDQHYYREWMHELPPLRHGERRTIIDVHHTILPPTGRVRPDAGLLLEKAQRLDGNVHVLCAPDMLLHSAAHLFQDGVIRGGLRDLLDQRDMIADFGSDPAFWPLLFSRARALGLTRPLYYTLRYARRLLDVPIPREVVQESRAFGPSWPVGAAMDRLVPPALFPAFLFESNRRAAMAARVLFLRSHWLRMPPAMLAGHLGRKAMRRLKGSSASAMPDAARKNAR